MKGKALTVGEALRLADMTEMNLDAFEATAPKAVAAIGGRDALARRCEDTCVGPLPRFSLDEWLAMSEEYEQNREHGSLNRGS